MSKGTKRRLTTTAAIKDKQVVVVGGKQGYWPRGVSPMHGFLWLSQVPANLSSMGVPRRCRRTSPGPC